MVFFKRYKINQNDELFRNRLNKNIINKVQRPKYQVCSAKYLLYKEIFSAS